MTEQQWWTISEKRIRHEWECCAFWAWRKWTKRCPGFFKVVVQSVLLFGSEMWVMDTRLLRDMGTFYNQVSCYIIIRQHRRQPDRSWVYPPIVEDMEEAGLWSVEEYITQWKTPFHNKSWQVRYIRCVCICRGGRYHQLTCIGGSKWGSTLRDTWNIPRQDKSWNNLWRDR